MYSSTLDAQYSSQWSKFVLKSCGDRIDFGNKLWGHVPPVLPANYPYDSSTQDLCERVCVCVCVCVCSEVCVLSPLIYYIIILYCFSAGVPRSSFCFV